MSDPRPDAQPVTPGRVDRSAAERRARRDVLIFVGIFCAVLLINGLLVVAVMAWLHALGWWDTAAIVCRGPIVGRCLTTPS